MQQPESFLDGKVLLHAGDCLDVLKTLAPNSIDACVCDPPYGLSFMGKAWDHGVPGIPYWKAVFRVLKPGAHLIAFGGTRTFGRMHVAIEDAGFEIRDMISWLYGSGFPKSLDVSKAIDKAAGAEREVTGVYTTPSGRNYLDEAEGVADRNTWGDVNSGFKQSVEKRLRTSPATDDAAKWSGFGTALKPACEPIVLARKPLIGTVAENVLKHGTGALNIDGCRVGTETTKRTSNAGTNGEGWGMGQNSHVNGSDVGRWPANVIHDGSDEVVGAFPQTSSGLYKPSHGDNGKGSGILGAMNGRERDAETYGDAGSAARFFYTAKADADDRLGSKHPTVKPLDLMQWLVRLVTPKGGLVLDPFAGTGTTGEAAFREGMRAVLIEREPEYQNDIRRRMAHALAGPQERKHTIAKVKNPAPQHEGLFALLDPGAAP